MERDKPGHFINYKSRHSSHYIPCDEINTLLRDYSDNIWLGFHWRRRLDGEYGLAAVHQPLAEPDGGRCAYYLGTCHICRFGEQPLVWCGSFGLARKDYATGKLTFNTRIPGFENVSGVPTINSVIQRKNGELWFGTYDGGILVYKKGEKVRVLTEFNTPTSIPVVPRRCARIAGEIAG